MARLSLVVPVLAGALAVPAPALADLPAPVRAMIDAAIETGDEAKVRTVLELAAATNPDDRAEVDAILAAYETDLAAAARAEAAAETDRIRRAGLFGNWSGKGELGGFRSTGNAANTGITAGLSLVREGIDWRHNLSGRADYQETEGVVTREQFLAAYEPNWKITPRLYAYGLARFERDPFQGFAARYSLSGGIGYDILTGEEMALTVKAGPAWRRTELVGGGDSANLAGLAELDFDWQLLDTLSFTQNASAFVQSGSSTFISDSGIVARVAGDFSLRLSYTLEHDTDPPAGAVQTDTLSRVTLIYDF